MFFVASGIECNVVLAVFSLLCCCWICSALLSFTCSITKQSNWAVAKSNILVYNGLRMCHTTTIGHLRSPGSTRRPSSHHFHHGRHQFHHCISRSSNIARFKLMRQFMTQQRAKASKQQSIKATKHQSNKSIKATKHQSINATKQQRIKATKQQSIKASKHKSNKSIKATKHQSIKSIKATKASKQQSIKATKASKQQCIKAATQQSNKATKHQSIKSVKASKASKHQSYPSLKKDKTPDRRAMHAVTRSSSLREFCLPSGSG
jgi:hypothetical protein